MFKLAHIFAATIVAGAVFQVSATEKVPDPSDLTQTNTSAYVGLSNQGDFKASVSGDFSFSNGQTGMMTLEGTMNQDGKYSDSRFQYFHVFNTTNSVVPRAAVSLDVIDNSLFTSASVGTTIAINSGVKGLNIFPRAGVLAGQYSSETLSQFNITDDSAVGGSAALYVFYTMGNDGSYIGLYPEYNYLGGDADASILKTTLMMGTPLSKDKKRWGMIRLENTDSRISSQSLQVEQNDTVVWANYKFYF